MKVIDNINSIVRDDLKETIKKGSKISVAAACFSMYAYQELKEQLNSVESFRFIFTEPTFSKDKANKSKREFYIPRINRENSLYGTEFEIKLHNEMTQKAIAKECANWVKNKAIFKTIKTGSSFQNILTVENSEGYTYLPFREFTTIGLGCEKGNSFANFITQLDTPETKTFLNSFDSIWNDKDQVEDITSTIVENLSSVYAENSPEFIYFVTLYNVFSEFLEDLSEDYMPNEATGFKDSKIWNLLYDFQKDAVLAIINKLEKYNGCILADSVGLGKTFTALAVIKYYQNRNKSILVLCPKKLEENWNTYKDNYKNNLIAEDRLNYSVLYHTDLARKGGMSNGIDLDRINWGNYDLVVIDESHNFRNGEGTHTGTIKQNRYQNLMNKVIKTGVKTKVLMLSATPVNNRFIDLRNQLAIAYEGNSKELDEKLNTKKSIDEIFKQAQKKFNAWSKLPQEKRTTKALLNSLDFDFFILLDSVTIARSRRHIEKYYNTNDIGKFPERLPPISKSPSLSTLKDVINYKEIYSCLNQLSLKVYTPSEYIHRSRLEKYFNSDEIDEFSRFGQSGREKGIKRLMSINLLKRLESSIYSFNLTLMRIRDLINATLKKIDDYEETHKGDIISDLFDDDFDIEDSDNDLYTTGKKVQIYLGDMDYESWKIDLKWDKQIIENLYKKVSLITPENDLKLHTLKELICNKIENPINDNNKKIIIFSAFAETASYLYDNISSFVKQKYGLETALVSGTVEGKSTVKNLKISLNNVLTCFSPISKNRELLMPNSNINIDILIATDCISEGQNLQDCDYLVNYDIHWNPVRIIQRFGRIDRIGSKNSVIQLVNFWPDVSLDEYINLKSRVEARMKISVMTSTGDDDLINAEEKGDLEYRKQQLLRLQKEVVDLEEMNTGISIMDLGLNEFRLDLLEYIKTHDNVDNVPKGLHAVVKATDNLKSGAIFILKNVNHEVNINNKNLIHPFYMVYIANDGEVICDYLNPKQLLDDIRKLCRGQAEPIHDICAKFNALTDDGKNMSAMSDLLTKAISSIIAEKEISDIDSLFVEGGTTALLNEIKGLEDFELISFFVVL